jgi:hypothetical protein
MFATGSIKVGAGFAHAVKPMRIVRGERRT